MKITYPDKELKEDLEYYLQRKPTDEELENLKKHIEQDKHEWIKENIRSFTRIILGI